MHAPVFTSKLGIRAVAALLLLTMQSVSSSHISRISGECKTLEVGGDREKIVCVCNKHQCHKLEFEWPTSAGQAKLIESSRSGKRFEVSDVSNDQGASSNNLKIRVDLKQEHQSILGWGGAFTDATGINLYNLSKDLSDELINSYFGADGLQYNIGRVPIGGSDFSARAYTYLDSEKPDLELKNWQLADEDIKYKIPYIKQAQQVAKQSGTEVKLFGSPWSPPAWMKSNNNLVRGTLKDDDEIFKAYANYLMKFYDAYEQNGIKFWGATVQNEPVVAYLPTYFFNSLQLNNRRMIKFVGEYLGPAMERRGWNKDNFKLMIGDDNLGFINYQVPTVMRDPKVQKYISGLAFHWYTSGAIVPYDALNSVVNQIKDKIEFVMMSEACTGSMPMEKKTDLGSWARGEAYALDIMEDLVRHTASWIDWNMALNMEGGPNWSKNYVDSPILVDAAAGEFYKQPMYYALAHFSRFFKPDSIRVESKQVGVNCCTNRVKTVAVHDKKSGHLIVNILNRSSENKTIDITVDGLEGSLAGSNVKTVSIAGKSISTVVLKL